MYIEICSSFPNLVFLGFLIHRFCFPWTWGLPIQANITVDGHSYFLSNLASSTFCDFHGSLNYLCSLTENDNHIGRISDMAQLKYDCSWYVTSKSEILEYVNGSCECWATFYKKLTFCVHAFVVFWWEFLQKCEDNIDTQGQKGEKSVFGMDVHSRALPELQWNASCSILE